MHKRKKTIIKKYKWSNCIDELASYVIEDLQYTYDIVDTIIWLFPFRTFHFKKIPVGICKKQLAMLRKDEKRLSYKCCNPHI